MPKNFTQREKNARRESTSFRDDQVHHMYQNIIADLGPLASVVSKGYIYDLIHQQTMLSVRTISFILNHTKPPKAK